MKQILLPVLCAIAALSFFTPQAQAQTSGTGAGGAHRRGGTGLEQRAREIVAKFDKNGDGKLEAGELVALLTAMREHLMQRREQGQGRTTPTTTSNSTAPDGNAVKL